MRIDGASPPGGRDSLSVRVAIEPTTTSGPMLPAPAQAHRQAGSLAVAHTTEQASLAPRAAARPTSRATARPVRTGGGPPQRTGEHREGAPRVDMAVRSLAASASSVSRSSVTIAIPLDVIPAVTIVQAPPGLVTKRNAAYLGMTSAELLRILRAMSADPRFAAAVVRHGKSLRGAPPETILDYLRAAPPAVAKDDEELDLELMRSAGYELTAAPAKRASSVASDR